MRRANPKNYRRNSGGTLRQKETKKRKKEKRKKRKREKREKRERGKGRKKREKIGETKKKKKDIVRKKKKLGKMGEKEREKNMSQRCTLDVIGRNAHNYIWAKLPKSGKLEKSKKYYNFFKLFSNVVNFFLHFVKFDV